MDKTRKRHATRRAGATTKVWKSTWSLHSTSDTVAGLQARGHRMEVINDSYQDFGSGQFIWRAGDPKVEGYIVASDSRRDGLAAGF
jgi:gamma-glutamyltranspeptidase